MVGGELLDIAEPLLRVLPELASEPFPDEPLATCAACVMTPRLSREDSPQTGAQTSDEPPQLAVFTAAARCCTYHPRLANFLAGRALRRGGAGAERVRARIAQGEGVSAMGIQPPAAWRERWETRTADAFGRDEALTCPYWMAGTPLGCSIHADREAVCRTWHCRLKHGARSQAAWGALNVVLHALEERLAEFCIEHSRVEVPGGASPPEAFLPYYLACAERIDALTDTEIATLRTPQMLERVASVRRYRLERDQALPEVVEPRVREVFRVGEQTVMTSWSHFDPIAVPAWIFELLSRLDGQTPWREAVAATRAAGFEATEALVVRLWDRGLLGPPTPLD